MSQNEDINRVLAFRLFSLPLERALEALDAMEELDQLLMAMLEGACDGKREDELEKKIAIRRANRSRFRKLRMAVEGELMFSELQ